ncbi:MAG TPA: energy transducer TonB [Thermoanaerobaculia bacterium]|nr:energy transducer TonB [Thermoanaerobaculia bacterium]
MDHQIELLVEEKPRTPGVSAATLVSLLVHSTLIIYLVVTYKPSLKPAESTPMVRYVELMRRNDAFTEAPGPKTESAPLTAAFSDANRKASAPKPTGDQPTTQPGQGGLYVPPSKSGSAGNSPSASEASAPPAVPSAASGSELQFRQPVQSANAAVDWRNAIREAGKFASLGSGADGFDLSGAAGGEQGFAESGPLSFETQWYDWGDYAKSMVSRIRVNWYAQMPQLIKTGLQGTLTIRFTIHRDGRITDITLLQSSQIPPYDFAARKAIELSSPLNPLPKDFPNPYERVTARFFYNSRPTEER